MGGNGEPQKLGVTYRGLDFSHKRSKLVGTPASKSSAMDAVWSCAKYCNDDEDCLTYTVHTFYEPRDKLYQGRCYFHNAWLCDWGSNFKPESVGSTEIFSGVCRQEADAKPGCWKPGPSSRRSVAG